MPAEHGWSDASDPTGRSVREFRLGRTGTDRPVTGALWSPADAARTAPLAASAPMVLFGHGASGNRYQAPICHLAHRFVDEAGCYALSIDGPVHGMRQVGPGGRAAFGDEAKRSGFIDDMVADWHAALDATREQVGVGALAYFGLSMGSIFGIPLVATLTDVKAAVLGLLGTTKAGSPFATRILRDAARIRCPVLFLMQLEDELFPRDGYLAVFDALASSDKRLHANPGLHPEVPPEEIAASFAFIEARTAAADVPVG